MSASVVSCAPASSTATTKRLIMAAMIPLADGFGDPYILAHETTGLHSDPGCGRCRQRVHPHRAPIQVRQETRPHRSRAVRRAPRDAERSRRHTRRGARRRLHRRRAALVVRQLRPEHAASRRRAEAERPARAVRAHFGESVKTLDDWKEWADHFNTAGAAARKSGLWLAFHNEADHMKPLDASGQIPYDVFVERLDPAVPRLQLDGRHTLIGGGDPMQ